MLFIVSGVTVGRGEPGAPLRPVVARASGEKCPRCWRYVTETAPDANLAGVCLRCADALGDASAGRS
jgi:isoleucyl-tRNA synthetase